MDDDHADDDKKIAEFKDQVKDALKSYLKAVQKWRDDEKKMTEFPISKVDPLEFWPQNPKFGSLFMIVRILLAIPASSASSERSFSDSGLSVSAKRARLLPATVKWLTIISCFLKATGLNKDTDKLKKMMEKVIKDIKNKNK